MTSSLSKYQTKQIKYHKLQSKLAKQMEITMIKKLHML